MTVPVTVRAVASRPDVQVLERLWQLYRHDLSAVRGMLPGADGLFSETSLRSYIDGGEARHAYLVYEAAASIGFALVHAPVDEPAALADFFIVRAARGRGGGRAAALCVLNRHPGDWRIAFQEANADAARFWRSLARDLSPDAEEERLPVPGKPHVPPDVWLTLRTAPR